MRYFIRFVTVNVRVWIAGRFCIHEDIYGRTYRDVYKKFGHKAMVMEYMEMNSWRL